VSQRGGRSALGRATQARFYQVTFRLADDTGEPPVAGRQITSEATPASVIRVRLGERLSGADHGSLAHGITALALELGMRGRGHIGEHPSVKLNAGVDEAVFMWGDKYDAVNLGRRRQSWRLSAPACATHAVGRAKPFRAPRSRVGTVYASEPRSLESTRTARRSGEESDDRADTQYWRN